MRLADVEFSERDGVIIARIVGEIDLSNANELANAISDRSRNDALGTVLDLTGTDYLDSGGIHMLYRLRERLRARGQSFTIVVPEDSPTIDALRLAGVESNLDVRPTLDAALEPPPPHPKTSEETGSECSGV
jgi:anti-sigma B factor antagonist